MCREAYPPVVCVLLWVLCEVSIVALDLTMVLGEWSNQGARVCVFGGGGALGQMDRKGKLAVKGARGGVGIVGLVLSKGRVWNRRGTE